MPRKPRKSGFENFVEALALLPWQACLALAPLVYFVFHGMAQLQPVPAQDLTHLGDSVQTTIFKTAGMFLQILVPMALCFAALTSWLAKRRRSALLAEAESRTSTAPLQNLSWREFEQLVGAHFERLGYTVMFTPEGADGGVDVVARMGSETSLIQCKRWRATKVGVSVVRELFGVMAARGAATAYVVSIGSFTDDARDFASGRNIELVDAQTLLNSSPCPHPQLAHTTAPAIVPRSMTLSTREPQCPRCGAQMVRRVAKQGANAGQPFFGCSTFPKCRAVSSTTL